MRSRYSAFSKLFFIFTVLAQIKEKMHMPVTVCFPDFSFDESIHMLFSGMGCFRDIPFLMTDAKIK